MSRITIRVKGGADFAKNTQKVLRNIESGAEEALGVTAASILADAQQNTPVRTGRLRDSEEIEKEDLIRYIGTNLDYSLFVHEGTHRMAARPFLVNAFEVSRNDLIKALKAIKVI